MAKLAVVKTSQNETSVASFMDSVEGDQKRKDADILLNMMKKVTKQEPKMWGGSIIGFGKEIVTSPTSGRQVEWFHVGFSPRKANLSIMVNNVKLHAEALKLLGKHKLGGGCIYINKLADVDLKVLEQIVKETVKGKK